MINECRLPIARPGVLLVQRSVGFLEKRMKTRISGSDDEHQHMFYFANLDTLVLVENLGDKVVIRATRDSFTERHKMLFIHELAAEGFIPNSYQFFSDLGSPLAPLDWLVDATWLRPSPGAMARARKLMIGLLISAAILWGGSIGALFLFCR